MNVVQPVTGDGVSIVIGCAIRDHFGCIYHHGPNPCWHLGGPALAHPFLIIRESLGLAVFVHSHHKLSDGCTNLVPVEHTVGAAPHGTPGLPPSTKPRLPPIIIPNLDAVNRVAQSVACKIVSTSGGCLDKFPMATRYRN